MRSSFNFPGIPTTEEAQSIEHPSAPVDMKRAQRVGYLKTVADLVGDKIKYALQRIDPFPIRVLDLEADEWEYKSPDIGGRSLLIVDDTIIAFLRDLRASVSHLGLRVEPEMDVSHPPHAKAAILINKAK